MESPYIQAYVVLNKLFQGEISNSNKKGTGHCSRTEAGNFCPLSPRGRADPRAVAVSTDGNKVTNYTEFGS
jgi:hypothetical protein